MNWIQKPCEAKDAYWREASWPGLWYAIIVVFVLVVVQFIWCHFISSCEGSWWDYPIDECSGVESAWLLE